ncbi:unnamed protein product, partial [Musa textilis]
AILSNLSWYGRNGGEIYNHCTNRWQEKCMYFKCQTGTFICFIHHGSRCCKTDAQMLKDLPALHCGTEGLEILSSTQVLHEPQSGKS